MGQWGRFSEGGLYSTYSSWRRDRLPRVPQLQPAQGPFTAERCCWGTVLSLGFRIKAAQKPGVFSKASPLCTGLPVSALESHKGALTDAASLPSPCRARQRSGAERSYVRVRAERLHGSGCAWASLLRLRWLWRGGKTVPVICEGIPQGQPALSCRRSVCAPGNDQHLQFRSKGSSSPMSPRGTGRGGQSGPAELMRRPHPPRPVVLTHLMSMLLPRACLSLGPCPLLRFPETEVAHYSGQCSLKCPDSNCLPTQTPTRACSQSPR